MKSKSAFSTAEYQPKKFKAQQLFKFHEVHSIDSHKTNIVVSSSYVLYSFFSLYY